MAALFYLILGRKMGRRIQEVKILPERLMKKICNVQRIFITDIMIVTYSLCIQDLKHCLMKYLNLWWNQVIFSIWLE